jgi:hypothetical protein
LASPLDTIDLALPKVRIKRRLGDILLNNRTILETRDRVTIGDQIKKICKTNEKVTGIILKLLQGLNPEMLDQSF